MLVSGSTVQAQVGISDAGVTGGTQTAKSFTDGALGTGQIIVSCSQLSPISNSNLVFVQEAVTGTAQLVTGVSVLGLLV